jgi:predicted TIM-barrel fold metal-dependent hydrolase
VEIKYGAISADSHAAFHKDAFISHMSVSKWGDKIPHVAGVEKNGERVDGWSTYGAPPGGQVANVPALMGEPIPHWPKRWEEVPSTAYDPAERLKALDIDGVDAEVLFPNPPGASYSSTGDADFELDAVCAYNDILSEWVTVSDRYWPLAGLPWLQDPSVIGREIERAVEGGHRGINAVGRPARGLLPLTNPYWDSLWDACQEMGVPVHFHGSVGLDTGWGRHATSSSWDGYNARQGHTVSTSLCAVAPSRIIPQLIFSGITQRFPRLKFVFAEEGIGGFMYAMAACDYEWESRRLWEEGITTRPSDIIRRQIYVNFWFETEGIKMRHDIGIDNIMWESDFPHVTSYYPKSREVADSVLAGVPADEQRKILYENALKIYGVKAAR